MINYLEHHIVDHCNLKCNGCSHFSGLADEWFEDFDDFYRDFSKLKEVTNGEVGVIRIMGGEPLLHPQVKLFLVTTRLLFPKSQVQLVTNGILLKKMPEVIDICNQYGIIICISNYDINIDLQNLLDKIDFKRVDNKGKMYNISLDLNGNQDIDVSFNNCDLHFYKWFFFQNGRFYHCCIGANIRIYNKYFNRELPEPEGISIYEHNENEIISYLNRPIDLCKYCNTIKRHQSYHDFSVSKREESEWICQ